MTRLPRHVIVVLAIVLMTLVRVHPAGAETKERTRADVFRSTLLELVNETRAHHGLRRLELNRALSEHDWWHSLEMARRGRLFHTANLSSLVRRYGATTWGENIGYADTLLRVHDLWMASPTHRTQMLDPDYDHVGIGVVRLRGWLWVTMNLYG